MQRIITLDLEGVLIPEIWQLVAKSTGIEELELTTRDIADYDELMELRIRTLNSHNITIDTIQQVLSTVEPLDGALEFLNTLRLQTEVILLSDTFIEFFTPLREKLGLPTIFCNSLDIDRGGKIQKYIIRIADGKKHAVRALQGINSIVAAAGDSYNDLNMLKEADYGAWFRSPQRIREEFPDMPVFDDYTELAPALLNALSL